MPAVRFRPAPARRPRRHAPRRAAPPRRAGRRVRRDRAPGPHAPHSPLPRRALEGGKAGAFLGLGPQAFGRDGLFLGLEACARGGGGLLFGLAAQLRRLDRLAGGVGTPLGILGAAALGLGAAVSLMGRLLLGFDARIQRLRGFAVDALLRRGFLELLLHLRALALGMGALQRTRQQRGRLGFLRGSLGAALLRGFLQLVVELAHGARSPARCTTAERSS
jgi:hypothetical protein